MRVAFRTDASIQIGTGHVMRCLTLADELKARGAQCTFLCRERPGDLIEYIEGLGYEVHRLPLTNDTDHDLVHGVWLGSTKMQDFQACEPLLNALRPDWLVVDHYALDWCWESRLAKHCGSVMVIDDLADRVHDCRLLLDQNFGHYASDYADLVPQDCVLMCGPNYALLRPEFSQLRQYSLQRRFEPTFKKLLITMGGVDKDNVTAQVMTVLRDCSLPVDCQITVVMGCMAPGLKEVQLLARRMPWCTQVYTGVKNMANLMAESDLAIGAAGSTSWERCCLGLPSILVAVAENQASIAAALSKSNAAIQIELNNLSRVLPQALASQPDQALLRSMSAAASRMCDGEGASRVAHLMMGIHHENRTALQ
jgi:UDP-2,4-diacetamido-2,4,6-trideoxy-beta-L-altropyranose hydrolase